MTTAYSLLLEAVVKSTAILFVFSVAAVLLRRRSAAIRHLLWSLAFAALLLLPLLSAALPNLNLFFPSALLTDQFTFYAGAFSNGAAGSAENHLLSFTAPSQIGAWQFGWPSMLMWMWAVGAALSLCRMLFGLNALARLRNTSKLLTVPELASLAEQLGIRAQVDCLEQSGGAMPVTFGVFHPVVCLPADARQWTQQRLRIVLLHELAHVRRLDAATHLLGRTALALYWWNPLAWWGWNEALKERERAADDLVLNAGASATDYAGHLLEIARCLRFSAVFRTAAIAVARKSQLESRLSAILDSRQNRQAPRRTATIIVSLAAIAMLMPMAALRANGQGGQSSSLDTAINLRAASLIKHGDEARELAKPAEAKAFFQQALEILNNSPDAAAALIPLGITELGTKNFDAATNHFERAAAVNPARTGEATMWTAVTQQRQKNFEAADELFRKALAAEVPGSAISAATMELYAQLLTEQNRLDEAKAMQKNADEVRASLTAQKTSTLTPSGPGVYKIGGEVKAPSVLSKVEPKYSEDARVAKYSGTALLSVEIDPEGIAENIQVIRGLGFGLDEKAIEAIRLWRFKPATKNEASVRVKANIEINFRLL